MYLCLDKFEEGVGVKYLGVYETLSRSFSSGVERGLKGLEEVAVEVETMLVRNGMGEPAVLLKEISSKDVDILKIDLKYRTSTGFWMENQPVLEQWLKSSQIPILHFELHLCGENIDSVLSLARTLSRVPYEIYHKELTYLDGYETNREVDIHPAQSTHACHAHVSLIRVDEEVE